MLSEKNTILKWSKIGFTDKAVNIRNCSLAFEYLTMRLKQPMKLSKKTFETLDMSSFPIVRKIIENYKKDLTRKEIKILVYHIVDELIIPISKGILDDVYGGIFDTVALYANMFSHNYIKEFLLKK